MTSLYALIVGIEKYDLPNWNVSGPVDGALEIASWCSRLGAPTKNICMFVSIHETDSDRASQRKAKLSQYEKMGISINYDTSLNAIDTFWRKNLPNLALANSKLLVYWCGHGVTRSDRDRVLLHTDYNPTNLPTRVTSVNNLFSTLSTQPYSQFNEQLIVADVCGDFTNSAIEPTAAQPTKPVDSIKQHCYIASLDGENAQIQNGIGQFTEATLEVLNQYQSWPDLDDLKTRMDSTFQGGTKRPFKISIRSRNAIYDVPSNPDQPDIAINEPKSQEFEKLKIKCDNHIVRNELEEFLDSLDKFLKTAKATAFDSAKKSLQLLQSDLTEFRKGQLNATLGAKEGPERRKLIQRFQTLLTSIETIASNSKNEPDPPKRRNPPEDFFRDQVRNLLSCSPDLTSLLASRISSSNQKSDLDSVVDHLVGGKLQATNDFPLRRFKRIIERLVGEKTELSTASCQTLKLLTEILTIASYPVKEREVIENAMEEILDSGVGNPTTGGLSTSKIEDAKKLLVATRLKLLNAEFKELNVAQLFNKDMIDNKEVRLLLRKIYVVSEPSLKKDDLTLIESYAKACIDGLGYEEESGSYEDDLKDILREKNKDGAVISLLVSNEKTDAIKQLRDRFPLLLVVELPSKSVGLYTAIFRDLKDIDECLPHLSETNT